jgi:hypothetical protein
VIGDPQQSQKHFLNQVRHIGGGIAHPCGEKTP